jgi:hypothetical protein
MITRIKFIALFVVVGSIFSSCTKDSDVEYPTLKNVYFSESFDGGATSTALPTGWTAYAQTGTTVWSSGVYIGDPTNGFAQLNGYSTSSSAPAQLNSWLISPEINMDTVDGEQFSFQTCHSKYVNTTTNVIELYISTNYNGTNFSTANWTKTNYTATLPDPYTKAYAYVNSGAIDLSKYTGTLHFAFKYIGVPALSGTYQIDNVRIVY